jgi:outer membrane protein TolC
MTRALFVLSLALAWPVRPARAARYTLEELVRKVTSESPSVLAQRESVAAAQAGLRAAQLGWLPTGTATLFMTG